MILNKLMLMIFVNQKKCCCIKTIISFVVLVYNVEDIDKDQYVVKSNDSVNNDIVGSEQNPYA